MRKAAHTATHTQVRRARASVHGTLSPKRVRRPVLSRPRQAPIDVPTLIRRDPSICHGQPVIAGTRVTVRTVLACLAEGAGVEEIVADFPSLTPRHVRAVIAFAAASASEDLPVPALY